MSCSKPVVATNVDYAAEIIGDTGIVVLPQDPPARAVAMRKILGLFPQEYCPRNDGTR